VDTTDFIRNKGVPGSEIQTSGLASVEKAPRRTAAALLGLALLIGLVAVLGNNGEVQTVTPDRCRPAASVGAKTPSGETVVVPTLQLLEVDDTFAQLADVGLRPSTTRPAQVAYNISGLWVVDQKPAPGARVPRESAVRLTLQEGPNGLLPGVADPVLVPQLVGLRLKAAIQVLNAWNAASQPPLFWYVELPPLPPTDAKTITEAYCVTGQEPSAGTRVVQAKGGGVSYGVRLSAASAGR
jgi:PASTA domain